MSVERVKAQFNQSLQSLGKAALHSIFPKDFEYYLVAFELVKDNEEGVSQTVDYFSFPIQPSNIKEILPEINNVKKTAGGVVAIDNDTFVPTTITLSGTFGRQFKFSIGGMLAPTFAGYRLSTSAGKFTNTPTGQLEKTTPIFSSFAKTGYGCIKVMEAIKEKSRGDGYKLFFYNSILGNNYVVKFVDFEHSQEEGGNNMLPKYSMTLKSIAPLEAIENKGGVVDIAKNVSFGIVQKELSRAFSSIRGSVGI